jgi:hypothetical protein
MVSVTTPALWRTGIAVCALLALSGMLVGIATGLARFGVAIPAVPVALHGAMMICAVFGTVISLERAVALQRLPGLLSPLAAGLGGLAAWTIGSVVAAQLL